jgi:RimJ/RimL family protein N-acetyltransferase
MTCELSVVIDHPRILSRQVLAYIASYVFRTLGCRRCETEIDVANERSWHNVERLGFTREGTKRGAARDGGDVYLYGMLKEECKWLAADQA